MINAAVLRAPGINCNNETKTALELAGAKTDQIHINDLLSKKVKLKNYKILAIPGGFSYGDDLGGGKILANQIKNTIGNDLAEFIDSGKLVIGICNGFQVLMRLGFLPGNGIQEASLTYNNSQKFECRWVWVKNTHNNIFTRGINLLYVPVAHGEGKFVVKDESVLANLRNNNQIALKYVDETGQEAGYPHNPNGSVDNIAGITNKNGNVFGLMPHPERHLTGLNNPQWSRLLKMPEGQGLKIFDNMVKYGRENL